MMGPSAYLDRPTFSQALWRWFGETIYEPWIYHPLWYFFVPILTAYVGYKLYRRFCRVALGENGPAREKEDMDTLYKVRSDARMTFDRMQ